jgi:hypothetical protein
MFRLQRSLSTAASTPAKRSRLGLYLTGTTLTVSSIYLGTAYYASTDPTFNKTYFSQTPGSENALLLIDILKSTEPSALLKSAEDSVQAIGKTVDTVSKTVVNAYGQTVEIVSSVGDGVKKVGESVGSGIKSVGGVVNTSIQTVTNVWMRCDLYVGWECGCWDY